jgi:two-component system, OmpR family, phosphate regulon response regulator PhoB
VTENPSLRILVVDDDDGVQKLVGTLLKRANMSPIVAMSASEAAQILRQQPLPDLMLLDIMLPEISGIDFLKQMRSKSIFANLPVVILSALADPQTIRSGLDAGANRYLTKPYLVNSLIKTINEVLASSEDD